MSLLDAISKGTGKTVTGAARTAKEATMAQFDPRGAIYGLGMGVGPLIRNTVAEYNKQQGRDKQKNDEKQVKELVDIKNFNRASIDELSGIKAQMSAMNTVLKDIRNINNTQLRIMTRGQRTGYNTSASAFTAKPQETLATTTETKSNGILDMLSGKAGAIAMTGIAAIGGAIIWKNRKEIQAFLDDILVGAGLPTTDQLGEELKQTVKETVVEVGQLVGEAIVESVTESLDDLGAFIKDYTKDAWQKLKEGDPSKAGQGIGAIEGGALGAMVPGGWKTKAAGILGGGWLGANIGEMFPKEALMAAIPLLLGIGAAKFKGVGKIFGMGADDAATAATGAAKAATPGAKAPVGGVSAADMGAATRADASIAARQAAMEKEMADNIARGREASKKAAELAINTPAAGRGRLTLDDLKAADQFSSTSKILTPIAEDARSLYDKLGGWTKGLYDNVAKSAGTVADTVKATVGPAFSAIENSGKMAMQWIGKLGGGLMKFGGAGVSGLISGGLDYAENKDVVGALIKGGLSALLGAGGFAAGLFTGGGAVVASPALGFGGSMLGEYLGDRINQWRRGDSTGTRVGPGGARLVNWDSAGGGGGIQRVGLSPGSAPGGISLTSAKITGAYGEDRGTHMHAGLDIRGKTGDPVYAVAGGKVKFAGEGSKANKLSNYGLCVQVEHADRSTALYAHLSKIDVSTGDTVTAGQKIGEVGSTGRSQAPHLHLEIRDASGKAIDPRALLSDSQIASAVGQTQTNGVVAATNSSGETWERLASTAGSVSSTLAARSDGMSGGFDPNRLKSEYNLTDQQISTLKEANDTYNAFKDIEATILGAITGNMPSGSAPSGAPSVAPNGDAGKRPPAVPLQTSWKSSLHNFGPYQAQRKTT